MNEMQTLFTEYGATDRSNLIQYNQHMLDRHLVAVGYADSARGLRASYTAQPWDDVILLPFLFLWRQTIELQLKIVVKDLATLRRLDGDLGPEFESDKVDARLQNPRLVGHKLDKLTAEMLEHVAALGLQENPAETIQTHALLGALDNGGTGFRYAGVLNVPSADIDFKGLADALDNAYRLLEVVSDAATHGEGVGS
tara:strand:- start:8745 stop:9335 length:591 start_codon:yes stop_codon:yes gene_type:complete